MGKIISYMYRVNFVRQMKGIAEDAKPNFMVRSLAQTFEEFRLN